MQDSDMEFEDLYAPLLQMTTKYSDATAIKLCTLA